MEVTARGRGIDGAKTKKMRGTRDWLRLNQQIRELFAINPKLTITLASAVPGEDLASRQPAPNRIFANFVVIVVRAPRCRAVNTLHLTELAVQVRRHWQPGPA